MSTHEAVSQAMAAELDARIEKANDDIAAVRHEIEDQLHAMESNGQLDDQVQIALMLGQISYLDEKAEERNQSLPEKHIGLMERIRNLFGGQA
jgi:FtsZ-binding cell division protein ZapB